MKDILIYVLFVSISSCTMSPSRIIEKTDRNLQSINAINYQYNKLTIQGISENDTTFIEMFSTASFKKDYEDKLLGYTYLIQDSLIHPYFHVPLKTTYHYNDNLLNTAMVSPIRNSIEVNDTSKINKNVYNNVMSGQLPSLIHLLNSNTIEIVGDTIINDDKCYQLTDIKDEKAHQLFISKKSFIPVMLRIITNTTQPFIEEFLYKNFYTTTELQIPDYKLEVEAKAIQDFPQSIKVGDKLPTLILHDLSENEVLMGYSKNIKIIYLSMINCGPCQKAVPYIGKINEYFDMRDDTDFYVLYPMDSKEKLLKYISAKNINYPVIYNSLTREEDRLKLILGMNIGSPSALILDSENYIQHIIHGFSTNMKDRIIEEVSNIQVISN